MSQRVLVAYATKHGSTEEVAHRIAPTLREHGLDAEARRADEVKDLRPYDSVILGAPLYYGRWHGDAGKFLKRHRDALGELRIAIFALGPRGRPGEPGWEECRAQLDHALAKMPWVAPASVELFGGVIDPTKLHFPFNRMPAGDWRDWTAIEAWATATAARFASELVTV